MKYMQLTVAKVTERLTNLLPDRIGVVFDGWSDSSNNHYVALFTAFIDNQGNKRYTLLAFQPLLDETDLSANSYKELIESTFEVYGKSAEEDLLYLCVETIAVSTRLWRTNLMSRLLAAQVID